VHLRFRDNMRWVIVGTNCGLTRKTARLVRARLPGFIAKMREAGQGGVWDGGGGGGGSLRCSRFFCGMSFLRPRRG
jgi:hypothetical protein